MTDTVSNIPTGGYFKPINRYHIVDSSFINNLTIVYFAAILAA